MVASLVIKIRLRRGAIAAHGKGNYMNDELRNKMVNEAKEDAAETMSAFRHMTLRTNNPVGHVELEKLSERLWCMNKESNIRLSPDEATVLSLALDFTMATMFTNGVDEPF